MKVFTVICKNYMHEKAISFLMLFKGEIFAISEK